MEREKSDLLWYMSRNPAAVPSGSEENSSHKLLEVLVSDRSCIAVPVKVPRRWAVPSLPSYT